MRALATIAAAAFEEGLILDELERSHLRILVQHSRIRPKKRPEKPPRARATLHSFIAAIDPIPAILQTPRLEVLARNRAASILLTDFGKMAPEDRNIARWLFLDSSTRVRFSDWPKVAAPTVAALRAARDPLVQDEALERLVGELVRRIRGLSSLVGRIRSVQARAWGEANLPPSRRHDDAQLRDDGHPGVRPSIHLGLHRGRRVGLNEKLRILFSWNAEDARATSTSDDASPDEVTAFNADSSSHSAP
ncbi:MmyB family transcriptional regulator [Arthrobacter terrae]|uniref:MmyB family transcriptional regulator n=1 Tax=Arthrobacter terrae TaxID=2935737 RepID=UPI0028AA7D3C|nr:hypothetical protein [Arthrobacter terrae]